jgi:hypothetical protein
VKLVDGGADEFDLRPVARVAATFGSGAPVGMKIVALARHAGGGATLRVVARARVTTLKTRSAGLNRISVGAAP